MRRIKLPITKSKLSCLLAILFMFTYLGALIIGPTQVSAADPAPVYEITDDPDCAAQDKLSLDWDFNNDGCTNTSDLITITFRLLAGIVGIAVVGGITWGGMLYASSNGNASKAQQGITTIVNAVIGLLLFIFMFAITNFLVPGGVIG